MPLPPEERPGTHFGHMHEIFVIFSVKCFVHFLVHLWKIILTKNTDSSDDLTYRTLLGYYFSDMAVSFF